MRARIGLDRVGQQCTAATRRKTNTPRCARQSEKHVAADVGLEIDGEVVLFEAPGTCAVHQIEPRHAVTLARDPRNVQRFDVHARDETGKVAIPAPDHEID